MSDLISREAAIEAVGYYSLHSGDKLLFADKPLKDLPSAQPEIVRCKDCRYYMRSDELCEMIAARLHMYECGKQWNEDSFCCWGKKKGDEDE